MNREVLKQCTELSDQEKITFPEVVSKLVETGVEVYYADLLTSVKTYYSKSEAFSVPCVQKSRKKINDTFNAAKVVQAIRLSQSGKIKYQEFIAQVIEAGVFSYFVFIQGRKAVYFGKKGEQHVENFPSI